MANLKKGAGKLKPIVKDLLKDPKFDNIEADVLNAIVALLAKGDGSAASELWGEFVDVLTKKEIRKKYKDVDKLFEFIELPTTVKELLEVRACKSGRIDFRTTVGKKTKQYLQDLVDQNKDVEVPDDIGVEEIPVQESDSESLDERVVRSVNSKGQVTKRQDRKTRKRRANQTSSLSRSERKRIAKKAARTRKKDKSGQRRAKIKWKKAMKKRKQRGLKNNR